ncbi:type IX secretion system outer membrane channel protein PorV [Mucilaginibacter agri]|uniref:type IX secretion system outer membrane channel protein PorV n=1 Tax=Mucilaginibacter agri TaxID=2695265 RepID=UPI001FB825D8|nr:type IX secretion system outer membrane channel protein PorV [Mucilaginibacter agri]
MYAQLTTGGYNTNGSNSSAITTAVPFLNISPDARSGAMGDAGVALSPDVNATYWNPAKLVFLEDNSALNLSYSPWLRKLVSDINLSYLSSAFKLDQKSSVGFSLRYFNLGTIDLIDENLVAQGTYKPSEFSIDGSYSRRFGPNFSLGLTFRYIHSGLFNGSFQESAQASPANAVAADVSMYSKHQTQQFGNEGEFAFGADISNIGTKISYTANQVEYFLPTTLRIGAANTVHFDEFNKFTLTMDLNKLLVPTPPIRDADGNIIKGKDDNRSVVSGIFGSFSDAPGGFHEELQEIGIATGAEYVYNDRFALRMGYFYENPNKGNRQYFTVGAGLKVNSLNVDFAYLAADQQKSPLANTLRFSIGYSFGSERNNQSVPTVR